MPRSRNNPQNQLRMLFTLVAWLRRRGVPLWVMIPLAGVVLAAVLFRPAIEQRFGFRLPFPQAPAVEAPAETPPPGNPTAPAGGPSKGSRTPGEPISSDLQTYLTEVRPGVFESPAGLRYRPGSQQGHRLRHVMAHARDQPNRAGPHGVFDSDDPLQVFQLIDEAYRLAQSGKQTTTRREEGRTKHTVNLRRRIGYVGGQTGNADGLPPARRLRIILDGAYVITAYPVR